MPTRRQFLQTTAATGFGYWLAAGAVAKESRSPNARIAMASIGLNGKGLSDSRDAGRAGDMVAICDVDENNLNAASVTFPKAKKYYDFRKMLEEMEKSIDAVTVSTPDHCHAPAAALAMRMKKHAFVQKPLTHTIYEARVLGQLARENKLATQMGNHYTAYPVTRKTAAVVKAGVVGKVSEVHVWTNRPTWPQGGNRPKSAAVPASVKWDLWLGPAPLRPYAPGYHPFTWRSWWDFGTGALGDMACHTVNMPFMALGLRDATAVQARSGGHNGDSYQKWSTIDFEFPATDTRGPVKFHWYDGGKLPSPDVLRFQEAAETVPLKDLDDEHQRDAFAAGCLVIGDKGRLYAPGDYAEMGFALLDGGTEPEVDVPESPGHFQEWVRAIRGGEPAMSNFPDYAGPLTETILLGNLAVWLAAAGEGQRIEWDPKNLVVKNIPGLERLIKTEYRPGYSL